MSAWSHLSRTCTFFCFLRQTCATLARPVRPQQGLRFALRRFLGQGFPYCSCLGCFHVHPPPKLPYAAHCLAPILRHSCAKLAALPKTGAVWAQRGAKGNLRQTKACATLALDAILSYQWSLLTELSDRTFGSTLMYLQVGLP